MGGYAMMRRLRSRGYCPACGAVPSHWRKDPMGAVTDISSVTMERTPADQVESFDPRDVFRCPRCGFMGQVVAHPEDAGGYIDWDDWEFAPTFCPGCGARVVGGDAS